MKRKVCSTLSTVILAAVIAVAIGIFAARVYGLEGYIVMSGSMEPTIHTGSLCLVNTTVTYDDIEVGDVIAFEISGTNGSTVKVTHRAVEITEDGIETKGDANDVTDGISTTEENYVGKTVLAIPYIGYICSYLQIKKVRSICILILAAICGLTAFAGHKGQEEQECLESEA